MREIYLFGRRNGRQSVSGLAGCEHRAIGGNGESGGGTGPHTGYAGQAVWFAERKQLDGGTALLVDAGTARALRGLLKERHKHHQPPTYKPTSLSSSSTSPTFSLAALSSLFCFFEALRGTLNKIPGHTNQRSEITPLLFHLATLVTDVLGATCGHLQSN